MANLSDKFSTYGLSLATAQVEYLVNTNTATSGSDTSAFGYGSAGQSIVAFSSSGNWVTKRVQSIVAITPQDRITLEISEDGNEWSDAVQRFPAMESGSNKYGCRVIQVSASSNQLDVQFGGNGANGVDPWSSFTSYFWRVRVTRANLSAGFGAASPTAAGLIDTSTQSFAGVKTFNDGIKLDDAGGQSTLNYYTQALNETATPSSLTNLSSASFTARSTLILGDLVIVCGLASFQPSASGQFSYLFTLPVTAINASGGCSGYARNSSNSASFQLQVGTTTAEIAGIASSNVSFTAPVTFMYRRN